MLIAWSMQVWNYGARTEQVFGNDWTPPCSSKNAMRGQVIQHLEERHVFMLLKLIFHALTYHDSSAGTWVFGGRRWLDPEVTSDFLLLRQVVGHMKMRVRT